MKKNLVLFLFIFFGTTIHATQSMLLSLSPQQKVLFTLRATKTDYQQKRNSIRERVLMPVYTKNKKNMIQLHGKTK